MEECVYEPLRAIKGSVSAEHGIGLEKKSYLNISKTEEEIKLMKKLKKSLDPNNILNPGKVFD
jgi:FAD/FMN-containing dehydrogenase